LLTKEHCFICLWTLDQRFAEALQKEAGSSDFYDFPFLWWNVCSPPGGLLLAPFLELRSQGSFLLENLDFPSRVGSQFSMTLFKTLSYYHFSRSSQGLYTRFL